MAKKAAKLSAGQRERVQWLHEQLQAGRYPNASDLVEHFQISATTAYKDIKQFKVLFDPPLGYDAEHNGFFYEEPGFELPTVEGSPGIEARSSVKTATAQATGATGAAVARRKPAAASGMTSVKVKARSSVSRKPKREKCLSTSELVSILAAEQLKEQYATSPFAEAIESAYRKLTSMVDGVVSVDHESAQRILKLDLAPFPSLDLTIFDALARAIDERESVVLKYFSGQKATVTDKPCDPYHILHYKDNWYLVAWCHEKQDYRDFLMNRILSVEYPNLRFIPDASFDLEKHKQNSQLFQGIEKPVQVVAEFDKFAAHWIRLRPVHPTQKIVERSDGSLELSFEVHSYENLLRWILSFGEHARVLSPPDLQERVQKTIGRMNYLYNRF
ncbi:MAG: hypothetical protein B1H03_06225 [Planctomycetales bacterium 4484_113]|nr:MAG: hypothetical protein B1H03_06225 [Planctomycetales bacterium 4484_113]